MPENTSIWAQMRRGAFGTDTPTAAQKFMFGMNPAAYLAARGAQVLGGKLVDMLRGLGGGRDPYTPAPGMGIMLNTSAPLPGMGLAPNSPGYMPNDSSSYWNDAAGNPTAPRGFWESGYGTGSGTNEDFGVRRSDGNPEAAPLPTFGVLMSDQSPANTPRGHAAGGGRGTGSLGQHAGVISGDAAVAAAQGLAGQGLSAQGGATDYLNSFARRMAK